MTSPSDTSLVERLRDPRIDGAVFLRLEAADRIEALEAANADLTSRLHHKINDALTAEEKNEALEARNRELEAGLREAAEAIEVWGGYASPYFQEKHDLAADIAAARALIASRPKP